MFTLSDTYPTKADAKRALKVFVMFVIDESGKRMDASTQETFRVECRPDNGKPWTAEATVRWGRVTRIT